VSEIYGSGGYDRGDRQDDDTGSAYDAWTDYDPEAELERLGITRESERQRALAWDHQRVGNGDDRVNDDRDASGIDPDIYAIIHENDPPDPRTRQQAARDAREGVQDPTPGLTEAGSEAHGEGDEPYRSREDDLAGCDPGELARPDADASTADRPTETEDVLRRRMTELETVNAELRTENTQLIRGMGELESENAELGKTVTGLEAHNSQLESRLERLEHKVEDIVPSDTINDRMGPAEGSREKHERGRPPSSEALLFGAAAVGGILTTAADYVRYLPATYAGIGASVLAAGAAAVAWARTRKEG
jgi:hypothetical protein